MDTSEVRLPERCGIVLAAGEGKRLQSFIHRIRGDRLPKQYLNIIGRRSMLEHTLARAERVIDPRRVYTVVGQDHLRYPEVRRQLSAREYRNVIVQPENKETAPGLLLPLAHVYARHPNATVVVFPSDHFIVEEELFMAHVDLACRLVERCPDFLVLLGIKPDSPETDYGYILPGSELKPLAPLAVRPVLGFHEKPDLDGARELLAAGGLWNTMVMVCRAKTLIELVRSVSPRLHSFFQRIRRAIGTSSEREAVAKTYRSIESVNFSTGLLEVFARKHASRLLVLPVRGVTWSDWGSEPRLLGALKKFEAGVRVNGLEQEAGDLSRLPAALRLGSVV
ncbi:MAG TPA: sugar phosphate nucleotidyltransferase [Candidatus Binatia bacterium]|jgi:mannose-1-phosphate guanylyltransferase